MFFSFGLPPPLYGVDPPLIFFFVTKEEIYYMIAGYINTLQALWITK
jgi:hypothetical protein